jgi:hypothetical protein
VKNLKPWQATIMIVAILGAAGYAASHGAIVSVSVSLQEVLEATNMQVGSTYSLFMKDYSYIIAHPLGDNTMYCLQNGTTGVLDAFKTNQTLIESYAVGNVTANGGSIFIKNIQWNTSVTIPLHVSVVESYQGIFTYRTSSSTQHIPDCPTDTNGTFILQSNTNEQTLLLWTGANLTGIIRLDNVWLDLSALTQNCTLQVYNKIDGSNFVLLPAFTQGNLNATSTGIVLHGPLTFDTDLKITITSTTAEGATRNIFYRILGEAY